LKNLRLYLAVLFLFLILSQKTISYSADYTIDKTAEIIDASNNTVEVCLSIKKNIKKDIILLIDKSASVGNNNISQNIKSACKKFIEKALSNSETRISIISFSSSDNQSGKGFNDYADIECSYTNNKHTLTTAIDGIKIKGQTNLSAGLAAANSVICKQSDDAAEKYVVLFTDGVPNLYISGYNEPYSAAYAEGGQLNKLSTVISIGYFKGIDKNEKIKAVKMLDYLSDSNYYDISEIKILDSIYNNIYNNIFNKNETIYVEDKISQYFTFIENSFNSENIEELNYNYDNKLIYWRPKLTENSAKLSYFVKPDYNSICLALNAQNKYCTNEYAVLKVNNKSEETQQLFPSPAVTIYCTKDVNANARENPMTNDNNIFSVYIAKIICVLSGFTILSYACITIKSLQKGKQNYSAF